MYKKIVVEVEVEFEDMEILPEDIEEKLYEAISDVIEDLAPDNKYIRVLIEN